MYYPQEQGEQNLYIVHWRLTQRFQNLFQSAKEARIGLTKGINKSVVL